MDINYLFSRCKIKDFSQTLLSLTETFFVLLIILDVSQSVTAIPLTVWGPIRQEHRA